MKDVNTMLAALPMPAVFIDKNARIEAANSDALALLGEKIVGRSFITILRQPSLISGIEGCMVDHAPRTLTYLTHVGAQDAVYDVSCRAVRDLWPERSGVLLCFLDKSAQEQADQMRRDFVANVSHELRTPLTSIIGFIETLQGPARSDQAARERFLGIMSAEAHRMNRLIGDLLSLSRLESQERVRPTDTVQMNDVLKSTVSSLRPLAEEAGISLEFEAPEAPIAALGDADQLHQVFSNLIENAMKYGGSGGKVRISLSVLERDAKLRAPAVQVQVADFGAGIASHHLPRLTERFYRADSHRSRELGGTGLGLAIVKHIVNRHRGRLLIESTPGKGSVFSVILHVSPEISQSGPQLS